MQQEFAEIEGLPKISNKGTLDQQIKAQKEKLELIQKKLGSKSKKICTLSQSMPVSQKFRELILRVTKHTRELRNELNKKTDEHNLALRRAASLKRGKQ